MSHFMVDLETLGTEPGCVLRSIGIVKFDESNILSSFYVNIDRASCEANGMTVSAETERWWAEQSKDAQDALVQDQQDVRVALIRAGEYLSTEEPMITSVKLWGNGAAFDNVILAKAYDLCQIPRPWKFFNDMCFRTMKNLFRLAPVPQRQGTYHNAMDDAAHQVRHLQSICKHYGIRL